MTGGSRTQSHGPERMRQKNWPVGPPRQRVTQRAREVKAADKRDPHVGAVFPSWAARMQLFHGPDTWKGAQYAISLFYFPFPFLYLYFPFSFESKFQTQILW
jgi:hypothetical protein